MTFINAALETPSRKAFQGAVHGLTDLLAGNRLLVGLPAEVLEDLAQGAMQRSYAAGDTLFFEGDPADVCLLVEQGAVEVLRYDADGEERMLHRFEPCALVAEVAMFMPHGLYPMTARAQCDVVVWRLPRQALRGACERHPALALRLLESLSHRLYKRVNEVDWLTSSNAQQRLAAYLVGQSDQQGAQIELPFSQRHLAAQLGVRAETLNRMLSEWQTKGWIRGERRSWRLCDAEQLRQLAAPAARPF